MSTNATKTMLQAYFAEAPLLTFLTSLFQAPASNFYATETVEIDIERTGPSIAIAVKGIGAGANQNGWNEYTNKEFRPPVYAEETPLNGWDLMQRSPGMNPFDDESFQARGNARALKATRNMDAKIRRAIEWQCSQVLQTGVVQLLDSTGAVNYEIDYKPKNTHFPAAASPIWSDPSATPLSDLEALIDVINNDGYLRPDTLIFGSAAWEAFIQNAGVRARYDARRFDLGIIAPTVPQGNGQTYMGTVQIGSYMLDCWTYNGWFTHPVTGVATKYVAPGNVIVRSSMGRLDATWGAIPQLVPAEQRLLPYLGRLSSTQQRADLFPHVYATPDGSAVMLRVSSRPLMIPTAIDTFGCLDSGL